MPITITITANNAEEIKQLTHDLAYAIFRLPAEEITDTEVSTVKETSGAPVASAEQPAAQVAPAPAQTAPQTAPAAAPVAAPASVPQTSAPQSAAPTAPTAAPAAQPSNSAAPTAPASAPTAAPTTPPTAPTSVPQYDFNQLAVATMQLQQAGHNIFEIFQQFGITALNQLPKERYGEYAAVLRQRGAKI